MQVMFRIKSALMLSLTLLGMFLFSCVFVVFPVGLGMNMIITVCETLVNHAVNAKIFDDSLLLISSVFFLIIKLYAFVIFFRLFMHPIYFYIQEYDYKRFDRSYSNYHQPKPWSFRFLLSLTLFCLAG
jgi:hypothetical protein